MMLLELFVFKLLDTSIAALKSIFMVKGKPLYSAMAGTASYLFFILIVRRIAASEGVGAIVATLFAVFLGQFITQTFSKRFDKDKVWKVSITPRSKAQGQEIADKLKECNIPVQTFPCYNDELEKVLAVVAFSEGRAHSAVIDGVLQEYGDVKFNIVEIKNRF